MKKKKKKQVPASGMELPQDLQRELPALAQV